MKIKKYAFRILKYTLALMFILVAGSILLGYLYQESIKQYVMKTIQSELDGDLTIKETRFSVWEDFPGAAVVLDSFEIKGSNPLNKKPLAKLDKIVIGFNWFNVLVGKFKAEEIKFIGGEVFIHIDTAGDGNFQIFKAKKPQTSKSISKGKLLLEIEKISFKNVRGGFYQPDCEIAISSDLDKVIFHIKAFDNRVEFVCNSIFEHLNIMAEGIDILKDRTLYINTKFDKNTDTKIVTFQKTDLLIDGVQFYFNGTVKKRPVGNFVNLKTGFIDQDFGKILNISPQYVSDLFKGIDINGNTNIYGRIIGPGGPAGKPNVVIAMETVKGSLESKKYHLPKGEYNFLTLFEIGKQHKSETSILNIRKFDYKSDGNTFQFGGSLTDFTNIHIDGRSNFSFQNEFLGRIANNNSLKQLNLKGDLKIKDYFIDYTSEKGIPLMKLKGNFKVTKSKIKLPYFKKDLDIEEVNGNIENNNSLSINGKAKISSNDFGFKGSIANWKYFVLNNQNLGKKELDLHSNHIDLNDFLAIMNTERKKGYEKNKKDIPSYLIANLLNESDLNLSIDNLLFRKGIFNHLKLNARMSLGVLKINQLQSEAFGGKIDLIGNMKINPNGTVSAYTRLSTSKTDVKKVFFEMNEFEQTGLTSQNLEGKFSGTLDAYGTLNKDLSLNTNSPSGSLAFQLQDGKLINYGPALKIQKYIGKDNLSNLEFENIQNQITFNNGVILIPEMKLKNNVSNLTLSGIHDLNGEIDYRVKVNVAQLVLGKKLIKNGGINIRLKMIGNPKDPKIGIDSDSFKYNVKRKFQNSKRKIRNLFR